MPVILEISGDQRVFHTILANEVEGILLFASTVACIFKFNIITSTEILISVFKEYTRFNHVIEK